MGRTPGVGRQGREGPPGSGGGANVRVDELAIGRRVPSTKWVVRGSLGRGGMGEVLDVVKPPGIEGAMKVMHATLATKPSFVARFLEEARLMAKLRHPNIVSVIDFDTLPDGAPFMVMERLRGRTLRQTMRGAEGSRLRISARMAFDIARKLCEGLAFLHAQPRPVVHRDVKPENLFLASVPGVAAGAKVVLLDFGLAVEGDAFEEEQQLVGTPKYMAPEQLCGAPGSERTDQYAVALVLYEMLTSRLPWEVDPRDVLALRAAHRDVPPRRPSTWCRWMSPRVEAALLRALSPEPSRRFPSVLSFIDDLHELKTASDGSASAALSANTTAPTMATLAEGGGPRVDAARPDTSPGAPSFSSGSVDVMFSEGLDVSWFAAPPTPAVDPLGTASGAERPPVTLDSERRSGVRAPQPASRAGQGGSGGWARAWGRAALAAFVGAGLGAAVFLEPRRAAPLRPQGERMKTEPDRPEKTEGTRGAPAPTEALPYAVPSVVVAPFLTSAVPRPAPAPKSMHPAARAALTAETPRPSAPEDVGDPWQSGSAPERKRAVPPPPAPKAMKKPPDDGRDLFE